MPTNGAGQDDATEDCGMPNIVASFSPRASEGTGASFVSRDNEIEIGESGGGHQEGVKSHLRLDVVNPRARALFRSRKRPSLRGMRSGMR